MTPFWSYSLPLTSQTTLLHAFLSLFQLPWPHIKFFHLLQILPSSSVLPDIGCFLTQVFPFNASSISRSSCLAFYHYCTIFFVFFLLSFITPSLAWLNLFFTCAASVTIPSTTIYLPFFPGLILISPFLTYHSKPLPSPQQKLVPFFQFLLSTLAASRLLLFLFLTYQSGHSPSLISMARTSPHPDPSLYLQFSLDLFSILSLPPPPFHIHISRTEESFLCPHEGFT